MLITCKCLNVSISEENGHLDNLELEKLGLCSSEQRDPFFRERLGSVCDWKVRCEETSLVETRQVGAWLVHRCLACQTFTHATLMQAPCQMLVNADLGMTEEAIQQLRRCDQYSPVFNMVVKEPADGSVAKRPSPAASHPSASHPSAGNLSRKLTRALQARVDAVEEAVRLFREKQYADFEEFREKAHKDHRILSGILFQAEHVETSMANNNNRNIIPQKSNETLPQLINAKSRQQPAFGNPFPVNKPRNGSVKNMADLGSYKEDSLDSEGIFDLEGMDVPHNGLNSDAYDSDTDDSVSRDEGIHITREAAQQWGSSIAKSLPVNVPAFTQFHDISQDRLDQHGEEPQDIAASIKALARSVHGDVFGDLPRPRFSTQI